MADLFKQLSNDMAATVEAASPAIVRVDGRKRMSATGVVWSDGVIVTAHHVVTRDDQLTIGLPDGSEAAATLVGRDPSTDLAVLRTTAAGLHTPTWAEPEALKVGQLVLALGRPGRTVQATLGVISALGGEWRTSAGGAIDHYLQTDVVMYPGFSGGPLVGAGGTMLGLNTSALVSGISVALPTSTIRAVVTAILAHGHVKRGYLGVGSQPVRLPDKLAKELDQETALMLVMVEPDTPAGKAGLLMGDVIVALDGQRVRHVDDLQALLTGNRVGQAVPVRIVRGGQLQEVSVVIGERE